MDTTLISFLWISWMYISNIDFCDAIQCYSCKSSGANEIDANIRCLENAYLENCEEFYHYYNEVENEDFPEYDYYYDYDTAPPNVNTPGVTGISAKGNSKEIRIEEEEKQEMDTRTTVALKSAEGVKKRQKRASKSEERERSEKRKSKKSKEEDKRSKEDKTEEEYDEEDYDEEDYYDEEYYDVLDETGTTTGKPDQANQHYCYSMTTKSTWESYTVEKGCKKISYCKNAIENKPEWAHPWNFCCDRSRCNVKLVKDKPQRVYGMGCRRTDDCIQGHNSRPVCPHFFKSCPRISNSLVKMECRVKARTMASVKNGAKYRHMYREKKCYCSKGYFPRGPICTSGVVKLSSYQSLWSLIGLHFIISKLVFIHVF